MNWFWSCFSLSQNLLELLRKWLKSYGSSKIVWYLSVASYISAAKGFVLQRHNFIFKVDIFFNLQLFWGGEKQLSRRSFLGPKRASGVYVLKCCSIDLHVYLLKLKSSRSNTRTGPVLLRMVSGWPASRQKTPPVMAVPRKLSNTPCREKTQQVPQTNPIRASEGLRASVPASPACSLWRPPAGRQRWWRWLQFPGKWREWLTGPGCESHPWSRWWRKALFSWCPEWDLHKTCRWMKGTGRERYRNQKLKTFFSSPLKMFTGWEKKAQKCIQKARKINDAKWFWTFLILNLITVLRFWDGSPP